MKFILSTSGTGIWSKIKTDVECVGFNLSDRQLRIYFDINSWNTDQCNLIYTDPLFILNAKCFFLKEFGLELNFTYSEGGMQGSNFVDFDIDPESAKQLEELFRLNPELAFDEEKFLLIERCNTLKNGFKIEIDMKTTTLINISNFSYKTISRGDNDKIIGVVGYLLEDNFWKLSFDSTKVFISKIDDYFCSSGKRDNLLDILNKNYKTIIHDLFLELSKNIDDWESKKGSFNDVWHV